LKTDVTLDTYSRGEIALDLITFSGVGAIAYGSFWTALPLAAVSATVIATTHQFLDDSKSLSKIVRIAAIITAIALTTLSIPLLVSTLTTHSISILALETALQTTVLQVAAKTTMYCVFNAGLIFRDIFFFSFPSSLKSLKKTDANELKKHLLDFPGRAGGAPLGFQLELQQLFKEHDLSPLPLINFNGIGQSWTRDELENLHETDLSRMSLPKRAQIAELLFHHNLPPQRRHYRRAELPVIDYQSLAKKLTSNQLVWAHLKTLLDPKFPRLYPINQKFYALKLAAPRDAWIYLPPLTSEQDVKDLEPYQLSWYNNLFQAQPSHLKSLKAKVKTAFGARLQQKTPVPPYTPPPPLKERTITWKHAAIAASAVAGVAFIAFATYSYFQSSSLELPLPPPVPPIIPLKNISLDTGFCPAPISLPLPPIPTPNPVLLPQPPPMNAANITTTPISPALPQPPPAPSGVLTLPPPPSVCPAKFTTTPISTAEQFLKWYHLVGAVAAAAICAGIRSSYAQDGNSAVPLPEDGESEPPGSVIAAVPPQNRSKFDEEYSSSGESADNESSDSDMDLCSPPSRASHHKNAEDDRDPACPPTTRRNSIRLLRSPLDLGFAGSPAPNTSYKPPRGVQRRIRLQLSGKGPGSPAHAASVLGIFSIDAPQPDVRKRLTFDSLDDNDTEVPHQPPSRVDSALNLLSRFSPTWGRNTDPGNWNGIFALVGTTASTNASRRGGKAINNTCRINVRHGLYVLNMISQERKIDGFSPSLMYACWGLIAQALDKSDTYNWEAIDLEGDQFYDYYAQDTFGEGRSPINNRTHEGFEFNLEGLPNDFTKVWVYRKKGTGASTAAADATEQITYVKFGKDTDRFNSGTRTRISRRLTLR